MTFRDGDNFEPTTGHYRSLPITTAHYCPLLPTTAHYRSLLPTTAHYCPLPITTVHYHSLQYQSLPVTTRSLLPTTMVTTKSSAHYQAKTRTKLRRPNQWHAANRTGRASRRSTLRFCSPARFSGIRRATRSSPQTLLTTRLLFRMDIMQFTMVSSVWPTSDLFLVVERWL